MSNRADSSYPKMTFWMGQDTSQRIISRFYWEHMADDIRQFIKNCETCQRVNDAKFIMVDAALFTQFLLSHKCGTRYIVYAHVLMYAGPFLFFFFLYYDWDEHGNGKKLEV